MSADTLLNQAKALNNKGDYRGTLDVLDSIHLEHFDNPYYCIRRGIALYHLHREDESLLWFKKAQEKGLEEIDEMPGTYLPKTVTKWIQRAELWAPRRLEKNAFEAERRAKRKLSSKGCNFKDFDLCGFWDDCDYSLEHYVGSVPTDTDIAETEAALGYRLPESYKTLIKQHNGGLLAKTCFINPLQRNWCASEFHVESIYGIDRQKSYSLCGARGSKFWIEEWGYPEIGIAVCGTMTGGHDMIFLDYSDCGPEGEPCVVHINQESDYEITYLADSFADFVQGLVVMSEEDE